ncbi:MAG: bifunctional riboflavin kinase/FAD synthetase [Actinomycetota bacterium]|nr:bifunctional riboflavin kinase/FAD synthetase [Actinomycetota bacterium]
MQRWRGLDDVSGGSESCVVTIGMFDGVHRGHQVIIGRAVEVARGMGLPAVVLSFDPHPAAIVRSGSPPAVLTAPEPKAALLAELGVDVMCVLPFTVAFSLLSPEEFVQHTLVERLHAAAVVVGANFRFGHRAAGTLETLQALGETGGFTAEGVPLVLTGDETRVSSTYVRGQVAAGDVAAAALALGREHRIDGVVVRGDRRGRTIGYPTANVEPQPHAAVPGDGVYAGRLLVAGSALPAAISIGSNPTFDGIDRRVEAYVLDAPAELDLYDQSVGLSFAARLRDTVRFDAVEELLAQMGRDVDRARAVLS